LIASDGHVSNRLIAMAREYMATSDALAQERGSDPSGAADPSAAPQGGEVDGTPPGFADLPDMPGSSVES
jgi:hypothetical protein